MVPPGSGSAFWCGGSLRPPSIVAASRSLSAPPRSWLTFVLRFMAWRPGRSRHTPIGRNTTTTAVARWPSHVTVTVIEPLIRAVTSPVLDTLPTAGSLLAQIIAPSRTALPEASHIAALSCTVPRTTTWTGPGTIVTAAIGGGGGGAPPPARADRGGEGQPPPPPRRAAAALH